MVGSVVIVAGFVVTVVLRELELLESELPEEVVGFDVVGLVMELEVLTSGAPSNMILEE